MKAPVPFVFKVERSVCDEIDLLGVETGAYNSRAAFVRDAVDTYLTYFKKVRLPEIEETNRRLEGTTLEAFLSE